MVSMSNFLYRYLRIVDGTGEGVLEGRALFGGLATCYQNPSGPRASIHPSRFARS